MREIPPAWISRELTIREITIIGKVITKDPIRVGAGREVKLEAMADLGVLRVKFRGMDLPVIPGSSWKGVFRSSVERLAKSRPHLFGKPEICMGIAKQNCMDRRILHGKKLLEIVQDHQKRGTQEDILQIKRLVWDNLCAACKIFGAPSYISSVYFYDSLPVDPKSNELLNYSLGIKPGIAIDRRTGAAARRALYQVEYLEPGSEFSFGLVIHNVPNYLLSLIAATIVEINEGRVRIGGFKTRGFGRVKFRDISVSTRGLDGLLEEDEVDGSRQGFSM